jgi:hypothetical protein
MDWIAISLGVLVTSALIVYITRPWRMGRGARLLSDASAKVLFSRREAMLTALRDLDFDYTVGKVAEEDYGPMRQALLAEVATIMTQLDEEQAATEDGLEARIEAEVLAVRQKLVAEKAPNSPADSRPCSSCGRVPRVGDLYCRDCGTHLNLTCPECGQGLHPTDYFCTACGIEMALALSG